MFPITTLYGALSLLFTWALGLNISLRRLKEKEFSDGGSVTLKRSVKAHRNNVEWIAVGVLSLLFAEFQGIAPHTLHMFGGMFLIARGIHALGVLWPSKIRMLGAILTYLIIGGLLLMTLGSRLR